MPHPQRIDVRPLRVLIVIENMSYTFDTRVRNIARTLERNGCRVWVVCPRYPGDPLKRVEGGVTIHYFPIPALPGGFIGHVLEYLYSFTSISIATLIAFVRVRFDVIHICNPPDIFFPLGGLYRLLGRKFVFDLHDLCPELWQVRYRKSRIMRALLLALERSTVSAANHVLTTSETARERICTRDGVHRKRVTLVRNGPDLRHFPVFSPAEMACAVDASGNTALAMPAPAEAQPIEVGYIGDMNPQDGIDNLLLAARYIRHEIGRTDIRFVLIGDGSAWEALQQETRDLGLDDIVQFTGRLRPQEAMSRLSRCTLCVQPDSKNPFNDSCVMVKSLEYMALGKPVVAFDLNETRRICADAALYAMSNDPKNLAAAILRLADDPTLRLQLGTRGRRRVEKRLAWSFSERQLMKAYARLRRAPASRTPARKRTERLRWYWNRLRAMSPAELRARLAFAGRKLAWRYRRQWTAPAPAIAVVDTWVKPTSMPSAHEETAQIIAEANRYLEGHCDLLNVRFALNPPDWHLDPQTGTRAPVSFAFDIDYRNAAVAGNIKNIWELSRHRHLTVLATAHALTHEERYAIEIRNQLLSWLEHNPVARGVNWHSSLELAVRLIAWVWIERLLRGSAQHAELFGAQGTMWPAIYWHQWLIAHHIACGSSANNHLVGEMAGLFIASTAWPYYDASAAWRSLARDVLERQVERQTFGSGLNREQAFAYHCFSLELFLLAALEGGRAALPFSTRYQDCLHRMLVAIRKLTDTGRNLPSYGDDDGATALQLQPSSASRVDWLFRIGNVCTRGGFTASRAGSGSLAAGLLWPDLLDLGPKYEEQRPEHDAPSGSCAFADAGLFVLASDRHRPTEVFCLADAGPLGFLEIAAHGHADALAFTMNAGGMPVIVDPGTGCYFVDSEQRDYFRSTKAHNTVVVDGRDQSEAAGAFLWRRHANSRVLHWKPTPDGGDLLAEHDGYTVLRGNVTHRRRLHLSGRILEITDELRGREMHQIEWRLHFHPLCTLEIRGMRCLVRWEGGELEVELATNLDWRIARAQPDAGWYSPAHNVRRPASTLIGASRLALPATFRHRIVVRSAP